MTYAPNNTVSPFVDESVFFPPEFEQFLLKITDNNRDMATAVNIREIGAYDQNERLTGATVFNPTDTSRRRPVFRKCINFGALPNTTTKSVAHGISPNENYQFLKIYAAANDPTNKAYIPLPYASPTLANNIELSITATNVVVVTGSNRTSFTSCIVVLEYVKF